MFLHLNLCILIRSEEEDKNVNGLILKIKEFKEKIANNVKCSLWYGISETDKGMRIELPTFRRHILKRL